MFPRSPGHARVIWIINEGEELPDTFEVGVH